MKNKLYISILLGASLTIQAQQSMNFTQVFLNPYLVNPAYAGNTQDLTLLGHYRNQMLGFKGAPEAMMLTLHKGLPKNNMGLGLQVFSDRINIIDRSGLNLTYSYQVKINETQFLRFGLSVGFANTRLDNSRVVASDPSELAIFSNVRPLSSFNTDFGIVYKIKQLEAGLSITNLFNKTKSFENRTLPFGQNAIFNVLVKYNMKVSEKFMFQPFVLARSSEGLGFQISANAIMKYNEWLWAGINWDSRSSIGACVGLKYEEFTIGYHYGYQTNMLSTVSSGAHELMLGITLGGKKSLKMAENTDNPSQDNLYKDETIPTTKEDDKLQDLASKNRVKTNRTDTIYHIVVMKDGGDAENLRKVFLQDQIEMLNENAQATSIDETKIEEFSNQEDKEGDAKFKKDFPKGKANVIIAAYSKLESAKAYQKLIKRQANLDSKLVKSEKDHFYYVSSKEISNYKDALKEMKNLKKLNTKELIFGNIWLH